MSAAGLDLGRRGRGVDADHLPGGVDERAAGVAGLDVRVRLDQPGQVLGRAAALVARGDRLVQGGDRAGGDRRGAALAAGVAERDHASGRR